MRPGRGGDTAVGVDLLVIRTPNCEAVLYSQANIVPGMSSGLAMVSQEIKNRYNEALIVSTSDQSNTDQTAMFFFSIRLEV